MFPVKHSAADAAPAPLSAALTMWGLAAAFYLLDFFHRVAPAALASDLSLELAPTAVALGGLSSAYFLTYAGCQVPLGLLVDRIGPRRVITLVLLLSLLGSVLFGLASSLEMAWAGRLVLGASGAAAWTAMLTVSAAWFSPRQFARISGLGLSVGAVGALFSGLPLRAASDLLGWRTVILLSGLLALGLAVLVWTRLRDRPATARPGSTAAKATELTATGPIFSRRLVWLCLGQTGVTGSMAALGWLWVVPYLTSQHDLSGQQATLMSTGMMVAMALGALVFGAWSDALQNRLLPLQTGTALCGLLLLGLAAGVGEHSLAMTLVLLLGMGFAAGSMVLSFAAGKEFAQGRRPATMVSIVNLSVMVGSIVLPPAFGLVLDTLWQGELIEGLRHYPHSAFQTAFAGLGLWVLVTFGFQRLAGRKTNPARSPDGPAQTG